MVVCLYSWNTWYASQSTFQNSFSSISWETKTFLKIIHIKPVIDISLILDHESLLRRMTSLTVKRMQNDQIGMQVKIHNPACFYRSKNWCFNCRSKFLRHWFWPSWFWSTGIAIDHKIQIWWSRGNGTKFDEKSFFSA